MFLQYSVPFFRLYICSITYGLLATARVHFLQRPQNTFIDLPLTGQRNHYQYFVSKYSPPRERLSRIVCWLKPTKKVIPAISFFFPLATLQKDNLLALHLRHPGYHLHYHRHQHHYYYHHDYHRNFFFFLSS